MMQNYNDEIFNYLTKSENFESAFNIYQEFPRIKKKLIVEFWKNVEKEIKQEIKEFENDKGVLKFFTEGTIGEKGYEVWIEFVDEKKGKFSVGYNDTDTMPYFGLYFDQKKGVEDNQIEKVKNYFRNKELYDSYDFKHGERVKDEGWLFVKSTKRDFNQFDFLVQLLPERRELLVKEFSENVKSLILSVYSDFANSK